MRPISVVLVEPQPIFLRGLENDLSDVKDIEVVGFATKGKPGIELIRRYKPKVAVIAIKMRDMSGLTVVEELADQPETKILVLTSEASEAMICECIVAGASGYLLKWDVVDLAGAIRTVYGGDPVMCPASLKAFVNAVRTRMTMNVEEKTNGKVVLLTSRELEVLQLIAEGARTPEIAAELTLARETIKTYRRRIYAKLGVHSQVTAVQVAANKGLINRLAATRIS